MEKIQNLYLILAFVAAIVTILMSFCFLFLSLPESRSLSVYKRSRYMLSISYLILGLGNIFVLIAYYRKIEIDPDLLFPLIMSVASSQAFLFSFTLISLLNPHIITRKRILASAVPIIFYLVVFFSVTGQTTIIRPLNILFYIYYLFQLLHYTLLFLENEKLVKKRIGNLSPDGEIKRTSWLRISFFSALTIGALVAVATLFLTFTNLVILIPLYTIFYIWFAIHYLNYPVFFPKLKNYFSSEPDEAVIPVSYHNLGDIIERWVDEKSFLRSDITLNQLASDFRTNRTYLSSYINTYKQTNFSGWINSLRIDEATKLMQQHPEWSITRISDETGFTDLTCFCRHFKRVTGITPRTYRTRCTEKKEELPVVK